MLLGIITGLAAVGAAAICGGAGGFESLAWLWMLPLDFVLLWILETALAFAFLVIVVNRVDQDVPQEEDSPFYRGLAKIYMPFVKTVLGLRVDTRGLEKTPKDGRFMLVCNHLDDSDPAVLLHYFRNSQLAFISKRENKDMFLVGKLMHPLRCSRRVTRAWTAACCPSAPVCSKSRRRPRFPLWSAPFRVQSV